MNWEMEVQNQQQEHRAALDRIRDELETKPTTFGYDKHVIIGWTHRDVEDLRHANGWQRSDIREITPSSASRLRGLRGPIDVHWAYTGPIRQSNRDRSGWEEIDFLLKMMTAIFGEAPECPTHATNWKGGL